jgi:Cys-tRNA(Pro)/Cys-tRNA(Cys) deacylase
MNDKVRHALETAGIEYRVHRHAELGRPISNPMDFARAIGYDAERITKTLLLRATNEKTFGLVVASTNTRIDMKQIAHLLACKRVQLANADELNAVLSYPTGAVSPFGVYGVPIFMDEGLLSHPTILVGGGEAGIEIEVSPQLLVQATGAITIPVGVL